MNELRIEKIEGLKAELRVLDALYALRSRPLKRMLDKGVPYYSKKTLTIRQRLSQISDARVQLEKQIKELENHNESN